MLAFGLQIDNTFWILFCDTLDNVNHYVSEAAKQLSKTKFIQEFAKKVLIEREEIYFFLLYVTKD